MIRKTEAGRALLQHRAQPITRRQRAALFLADGRRSIGELIACAAAAGVSPEDVGQLLALGLIEEDCCPSPSSTVPLASSVDVDVELDVATSHSERFAEAVRIATQLTADLGLRGLRLNMAVERARSFEDLLELAPKIRDVVGRAKYAPLRAALKAPVGAESA